MRNSEERAYRDIKNSLDTAKAEGLAEGFGKGRVEGRAEGLVEGLAKGRSETLVEVAKNSCLLVHRLKVS